MMVSAYSVEIKLTAKLAVTHQAIIRIEGALYFWINNNPKAAIIKSEEFFTELVQIGL